MTIAGAALVVVLWVGHSEVGAGEFVLTVVGQAVSKHSQRVLDC